MFLNKIYILLLLCLLSLQVFGQLVNSSFEEWIISPDGDELPLSWDALLENTDSCVIKSNVSSHGLYSLKLSSLNVVESFFSPAYIGTKFKPNTYNNKVTFQYLIDSIAGESQGMVEIWQFIEEDYQLVTSKICDHTSADFISESIVFTLLSLDSILIVLVAQNHDLPIGYDGFISILFDNFVIDTNFKPHFQIGTTWIYEVEEIPLPIKISYQTYEITHSTVFQGKDVFVIENDFDSSREYMYVDGSMVYFWNSELDSFQLNFDFSQNPMYTSPWKGVCDSDMGTALVSTDSMTYLLIDSDTINVQHLSIDSSGTTEEPLQKKVFVDIGPSEGGLQLPLGYGFCDFNRYLTKLRCFSSGSLNYNFIDYSCDSTWFSTSIINIADPKPNLYPNPSNGKIWIEAPEKLYQFELYNSDGRLMQTGETGNNELLIAHKGVMVLRLFDHGHCYTYKVVIH